MTIESPKRTTTERRRYLATQALYIFVALAIFVAINILYRDDHAPYDTSLNPEIRQSIENEKPQTVLLGNSMLGRGINAELLQELTGKTTSKFDVSGSHPMVWYLIIKNQIVPAQHKPDDIIIFFRDTYLTEPKFRTPGRELYYMDDFASEYEPLLQELTFDNKFYRGNIFQDSIFAAYANRIRLKKSLEDAVKYILTSEILGSARPYADAAVERAFAPPRMNIERYSQLQIDAETPLEEQFYDFHSYIDRSYLEPIINLVRENDMEIHFVRVKRRKVARGVQEPEQLVEYIANLRNYLEEQEINFFDYTYEDAITIDLFDDADHLKYPTGANVMTRILARDISSSLGRTPAQSPKP